MLCNVEGKIFICSTFNVQLGLAFGTYRTFNTLFIYLLLSVCVRELQ